MRKVKNYSAQFKMIRNHPNEIEKNKNNKNNPNSMRSQQSCIPKKKQSKQNQEFINNISASEFFGARALRDAHMVSFFFADLVTCANFSNLWGKFLKIQNRYGHHVFAKSCAGP